MAHNSVCFLLSKNEFRGEMLCNAITECGCECRPLRSEHLDADTFLSVMSGCLLVDTSSLRNGIASLSSALAQSRIWIPIIAVFDTESPAVDARRDSIEAMRNGAFDVVMLPTERRQLGATIQAAIEQDGVGAYSPSLVRRKIASLTLRERQTIQLFLDGRNTKVVAKQLSITYQTVDKHRGRALRKLGFHTVVEFQNCLRSAMLTSMGMNILEVNAMATRIANPSSAIITTPSATPNLRGPSTSQAVI